MAKSQYFQIKDGEWFSPTMRGHKFMCCDCSLVHILDFQRIEGGGIRLRARRDNRATAAARRGKKKKK